MFRPKRGEVTHLFSPRPSGASLSPVREARLGDAPFFLNRTNRSGMPSCRAGRGSAERMRNDPCQRPGSSSQQTDGTEQTFSHRDIDNPMRKKRP